jgi:TPR repeat protein
LVGGILAVGMFGLAKAGQLEDGEAAYFKHDYAKAVRLLRPLADKGSAPAQNRLASVYFWGCHGVPQDPAEAALWYRKAGNQGNALAQAHLGLMYEHGYGAPKDPVMARIWLNLAVSRASSLSMAVKLREEAAAKMTPAQIAEAERLAEQWEPK